MFNWLAVSFTLLFGPVIFYIWSLFSPPGLKKFPTQINDGLGDTIFLPLFNGVAFFLPFHFNVYFAISYLLIAFFSTILFVHYQKKSSYLDWSKPSPGRINAGGWYHAFFMFIQLFIVLYFLSIFPSEILLWIFIGGYILSALAQYLWKGYV